MSHSCWWLLLVIIGSSAFFYWFSDFQWELRQFQLTLGISWPHMTTLVILGGLVRGPATLGPIQKYHFYALL